MMTEVADCEDRMVVVTVGDGIEDVVSEEE